MSAKPSENLKRVKRGDTGGRPRKGGHKGPLEDGLRELRLGGGGTEVSMTEFSSSLRFNLAQHDSVTDPVFL